MLINLDKLIGELNRKPWAKGISNDKESLITLMKWVEQDVIPEFLNQIINLDLLVGKLTNRNGDNT